MKFVTVFLLESAAARIAYNHRVDAIDFTSSTHMAVSVRYHKEDPFERLRLVRAAMPVTPLGSSQRGRASSWDRSPESVMRLSLRLVERNGIRRLQIPSR
jgi:oxaloacetate decarboxylase alpha subunit